MGISPADLDNRSGMLVQFGAFSPVRDAAGDGHKEITLGAAAQVLTKPARATGILCQTVNYQTMFTLDGTDPTLEPGFVILVDWPIYIPLSSKNIFTVARAGANDASFRYQWVREEN